MELNKPWIYWHLVVPILGRYRPRRLHLIVQVSCRWPALWPDANFGVCTSLRYREFESDWGQHVEDC